MQTEAMRPIFHFDLGSPYAYLAASRINGLFSPPPVWQPILLGALFKRFEKTSWALGPERTQHVDEIAKRAEAYGLPPLRYPAAWPGNYLFAMRAATYAKEAGRVEEFALAAYRRAFAEGEDLSLPEVVLDVATSAGLDREAVRDAVENEAIKSALREATDRAGDLGVGGVPTVQVGGALFFGDDRLEQAAAATRVCMR